MTNETTELRMCVTCGKMGRTCRWTDDPVLCMRQQLDHLRAALAKIATATDAGAYFTVRRVAAEAKVSGTPHAE